MGSGCGTPYEAGECPSCKAEQEKAKRVIEERPREEREEKDKLIRDVEDWLEEQTGAAQKWVARVAKHFKEVV